ncbi:DJ-1/PfpI family protein [Silicimonas algicola]|uniref:DJ-1/PfpI family protein n=1 Tax=Silicimonas algicola TaxID=1826607 RepID=A0A316FTH2_9RHOB|nr:DJ-1/PfpI family protein [Silicimonas algicola]AZQ67630.1 DJ-1/PfpI family protein [Silicimonas algicola]PWK51663.1 DJ-1/PfpI family protein [Silicimonas algicola]
MPIDRRTALLSLAGLALAPALAPAALAEPQRPAGAPVSGPPIAMLVYPEMTALDLVGPHHFLGATGAPIELVTTQRDLRPVPSDLGLAIQPTATLETCPEDVTLLFVPGGTRGTIAAARDPRTLAFVRDRASRARYVTSVCTGSLVLGAAGVLRGKRATSHWIVRDLLTQFDAIPTASRVVRDGNVITGAGVSAGLDFGLTLAAELAGQDEAEGILLVSEYDPEPPFPGGSPETARPEILEALRAGGLSRFVAEARTLRIAGA